MEKYISKRIDVKQLIKMLQKALLLEIVGIQTYWKSSYNMVGHQRQEVCDKFREIIKDEMHHCNKLATRIKELDGVVECDWEHMEKPEKPETFSSCDLVELNKHNEEEAMDLYYDIIQYTENKDHVTCYMITKIMNDEARHHEELQSFLDDFEHVKRGK